MEFIHAYASNGEEINPDFLGRTFLMLADHFGYDYEELEADFRRHRDSCASDHILEADAFTDWLFEAIEGDLSIQPKED